MNELDELLRESLGRLAEPGDPTGVLDAIRTRVDAAGPNGDGGTGPAGGANGGGAAVLGAAGTGAGFWGGWTPLGILIGLSVAGGAALGLGGALGRPDGDAPPPAGPAAGVVQGEVEALGCPGGAAISSLPPGTRVLAMERSEDGAFVSVRDPYELSRTLWLPTSVLVPDAGAGAYADLPVGGCAVASPIPSATPSPTPSASAPAEPEPAPEPAPAPAPKPTDPPKPPPPAPDTQAPAISAGAFAPANITGDTSGCGGAHTTDIVITATDNVGVTGISATDNHANVSVTQIAHSGNTWTFRFAATGQPSLGSNVTVTGSFTAVDAAGNANGTSATFSFDYCLF